MEKKSWETMELRSVGHIGQVVEQGGGKLSIATDDPGEPMRKPRGQE